MLVSDPGDDVVGARARREDLCDAELLELGDVVFRNDPAAEHRYVAAALLLQLGEDLREQRHVRAREDRQPDGVDVLLHGRLGDHLGRLVKPGVDDLEARVAQRTRDDLRAAVVPVEPGLGDQHSQLVLGDTIPLLPISRQIQAGSP